MDNECAGASPLPRTTCDHSPKNNEAVSRRSFSRLGRSPERERVPQKLADPNLVQPNDSGRLRANEANSPDYLRIAGVLEMLPISRRTLARWMESGQIPHIRAGERVILFRRRDIERMLQRLTVGGAWQ